MKKSDFRFELPTELIASYPCDQRSLSRLLKVPRQGKFTNHVFRDIASLLQPGDLVVVNNSLVIRARILGRKESGGQVEILVERLLSNKLALALVRANKPMRENTLLFVHGGKMHTLEQRGDLWLLKFEGECTLPEFLERFGEVPLPPYINRPAKTDDERRYQTVYAKHPGSVAAPTAGLHFDKDLLERLTHKGVKIAELTLHIGIGTFKPLRSEELDEHVMHQERLQLTAELCDAIDECRRCCGRVVAVGTTVIRALETACDTRGKISPYDGETNLFIRPGHQFQIADVMITNFHLPETTLFILVCAFAGRQRMLEAYQHAIEQGYRFFSYGDAMWLEKNDEFCD